MLFLLLLSAFYEYNNYIMPFCVFFFSVFRYLVDIIFPINNHVVLNVPILNLFKLDSDQNEEFIDFTITFFFLLLKTFLESKTIWPSQRMSCYFYFISLIQIIAPRLSNQTMHLFIYLFVFFLFLVGWFLLF